MHRITTRDDRGVAFACGLYGAAFWTAYAIVECWILVLIPWLVRPTSSYQPVHPGFTALLVGIYVAAGFVLGSLAGATIDVLARSTQTFRQLLRDDIVRVTAALTLVGAFSVTIVMTVQFREPGIVVPLVNAALLTSALLATTTSRHRLRASLEWMAGPMSVAVILLGIPWLAGDAFDVSYGIKAAIAVLCWAAILLRTGIAFWRANRPEPERRFTGSTPRLLPLAAAALATMLASVVLPDQGVYSEATPGNRIRPTGAASPIVLISLDTVRADHLSVYGYPRDTTPHLRQLASEATLYTQAMATSDMTLSSHASLFTGQYPSRHGAYCDWRTQGQPRPLSKQAETVAEILAGAGYRTYGVVSNYGFLGRQMGFAQGFHHYDDRRPNRFFSRKGSRCLRVAVWAAMDAVLDLSQHDVPYRTAEEINREVLPLVEGIGRAEPFLLFVNYMDAHWPYRPPPPFDKRFPGKDPRLFRSFEADFRRLKSAVMSEARTITPRERRYLESQYDGGIAYLDEQMGALLERLKRRGLYDRSLIIVTADHGEAFGDRNLIQHGVSVYQDQVHVPLVVKFPGSNRRRTIDEVVSGVDLLPTILDLLGMAIPNTVEGQSLLRDTGRDRVLMSESFPSASLRAIGPRLQHVQRALFAGGFKLISSTSGARELYDVARDADETSNLASVHQDAVARLTASLNGWLQTVPESASRETIDRETLERLKSLGYAR